MEITELNWEQYEPKLVTPRRPYPKTLWLGNVIHTRDTVLDVQTYPPAPSIWARFGAHDEPS